MNTPPDLALERRLSSRLLNVFIRAALLGALVVLCYDIFAPFLSLMAWSMILAVTLYPLHQRLTRRLGGRNALSATLLVLAGLVLIVAPVTVLTMALGDSVQGFVASARDHTLQVPEPPAAIAKLPFVGEKIHDVWSKAHADLPATIQGMQPQIADLSKKAIGIVAAIGGSVLMFLVAFIVAGIIMAFGRSGAAGMRAVFDRIVGIERGAAFNRLCTSTIRAVALGVLGVALIQAIVIGLMLLVAGVPFAGVLAAILLVLGIAQVPALIVTVPAIVYIWATPSYGTGAAITYTILLGIGGMLDNVLKPLLLGRGVEAPMPVVLLGALGGMASSGILGMFVGATFLALGYQIFMGWVHANPDAPRAAPEAPAAP